MQILYFDWLRFYRFISNSHWVASFAGFVNLPKQCMAAASRFVEISKEFLDNLLDNSIPKKTKRATKNGMKIFNSKFSGLLLSLLLLFLLTTQNYELFFINSKQIQLYFLNKSFQYLVTFFLL